MREEIVVALVMLFISAAGSIVTKNDRKWSVVFLLLASVAGSLAAGMGIRFREIVEGPFGFLDAILSVTAATVLMFLLFKAGAFDSLWSRISSVKNPVLKGFLVLGFIAIPSAFSGFAGASVLTTGSIVSASLRKSGVKNSKIVETVAVGSFLGMLLPPSCIPAIIAANGAGSVLPTPYNGFYAPLLALALPVFIVYALCSLKTLAAVEPEQCRRTPLLEVVLLLVALVAFADGCLGTFFYLGGATLWYFCASLVVLALAKGFGSARNAFEAVSDSLMEAVIPAAFVFALGSFIEVSSMTGVRGIFSLFILPYEVPKVMLFLMALSVIIGIFLSEPIPAFLLTYAVFPIGWLANPVIVVGISTALSVLSLITLRGGLLSFTEKNLALEGVKKSEVVKGTLLPVLLVLVLGVVFVLCGDGFLLALNF